MLFKPELAAKIPTGQKTQTRRIVKPVDRFSITNGVKMVYTVDGLKVRLKWMTGQTYAIQTGRGQKAIGRFRLLDIRRERVQDIPMAECEAEGIAPHTFAMGILSDNPPDSRWKFIELWDSINTAPGLRWQDNPKVWVLSFEYCEGSEL